VHARDIRERGSELALGEGAAGTGDVVAHRAVDAEELGAVRCIAAAACEMVVGDLGTRAEGSDEVGELLDLVIGELRGLLLRLRTLHLHRHAPGADLEVDRGRTDADERGAVAGALCVEAVARGAIGLEELLALFDGLLRVRVDLSLRRSGAERSICAAGEDESEREERGRGERMPASGASLRSGHVILPVHGHALLALLLGLT
jgi:hypothetical protein